VPALDGVRGYAAIGVLFLHTSFYAGVIALGGLPGIPVLGWLTVGLTVVLSPFFLLSGMMLYRPFARATFDGTKRPALKPFFARRMLRIFPTYLVVVAAALLLIGMANISSVWDVIRPIVLMHYFFGTSTATQIPGLEITWTVVTEVLFYLLLPAAAALINKYARKVSGDPARQLRRIVWSLVPAVLLGPAWEVYTHLPSMGPYPIEIFWPPGFIGLMAVGMIFGAMSAYYEKTGEVPWLYRMAARSPMSFWVLAFGVYLLNCVKPLSSDAGSGAYPPMSQALMDHTLFMLWAVLVMTPLLAPTARARLMERALGNKLGVFLGKISYGVYLWHFPVLYFAYGAGNMFGTPPMLMPGAQPTWVLIGEVLVGSIILATASYYLIERPVGRLGGRVFKSGAPTSTL
jgi:peptidoglycan/LPS O-acetylase OafA/YrhL